MKIKKVLWKIISFILLVTILIGIANYYVILLSKEYIYTEIDEIPSADIVLILGAQVFGDQLSGVLKDRVDAGIALKERSKVKKILVSGKKESINYDEPNAMVAYIYDKLSKMRSEEVERDSYGFDTYDSIIRAKQRFPNKSMIIVTQKFHINRAVYIARQLGIEAYGYSISEKEYSKKLQMKWNIREIIARIKAIGNIVFRGKAKVMYEE